jgi:class 3 adenylate cyclase
MSNVRQWLESLGLGQYADAFEENAVEVALLTELTDEFLQALGVSLVGHRMKLLRAVRDLAIAVPEVATGEGKIHPVPGREAERRQLTVMFADLVGSTELSQKLDPEDLREINRAYQDAAKKTIEEYGGYVARYMGDGVLAYFGFPQAHEDDPQQAVRAGSALIGAVGALPEGVTNDQDGRLAVRVGIATGTVIVGDIVGEGASQENAVVGETANLAARLQAVAPVGCVLVAKSTRDLIGAAFQCETQDPLDLKGFGAPVHAFVVREEHLLESRFASARRAAAALMGREEEVELCLNRWSRVENGAPQVVMLCGEPGIGKSRLVDVVREQIRGRSFVLQCSPRHTTSALYPVIRHFERVQREPSPASEVNHSLSVESAAILEELIERPNAKQAMAGIDARDRKERLLERLMDYVQHTAEPEPILVAVEDVHWADPTTIELLERLIREPPQRLLLTLTFRPEFAAPWIGRPNVLRRTLNRLDARDSEILVQRVAGERQALSGPVIREIVARADGVPLFIEELTRAVIEAGEASAEDTSSVIPATLQDSLTARLDSLSLGKEVA